MILRALFISLLLVGGCRHARVNRAMKAMTAQYDAMLGMTLEEVVAELGAPDDIQKVGNLTIFKYYQSYGSRSNAYADTIGSGVWGVSSRHEAYDKASIVFTDGIATSWKGDVRR